MNACRRNASLGVFESRRLGVPGCNFGHEECNFGQFYIGIQYAFGLEWCQMREEGPQSRTQRSSKQKMVNSMGVVWTESLL